MLINKYSTICEKCNKFHCDNVSKTKKSRKIAPAIANALLMNTSHDRVVLALKEKRLECNQLKKRIEDMNKELEKWSIQIYDTLNNDLTSIISENSNDLLCS